VAEASKHVAPDIASICGPVPWIALGEGVRVDHDDTASEAGVPSDIGEMGDEVGRLDSADDGELGVGDGYVLGGTMTAGLRVKGFVVPDRVEDGHEGGVVGGEKDFKLLGRD